MLEPLTMLACVEVLADRVDASLPEAFVDAATVLRRRR
jgi:hypothetical protein